MRNKTKVVKRRSNIERPFNSGTQTKAQFFGMLKSAWRKLSMYWIPVSETRNRNRRPYTGKDKRKKWEYQCESCKEWVDGSKTEVDHIQQIGVCSSFEDLPRVAKELFCEADKLQLLCKSCHSIKTKGENARMRQLKKEKKNLEV